MSGMEVEVITPGDVEKALTEGIELPQVENTADVARMIVERILAAETEEEVFAATDATGWREYLDVPMIIGAVHWNRSSFENGAPVYAIVDAENAASGERLTLTVGSKSVMAALLWFDIRKAWPQALTLTNTKSRTPEGFQPLRLVKA